VSDRTTRAPAEHRFRFKPHNDEKAAAARAMQAAADAALEAWERDLGYSVDLDIADDPKPVRLAGDYVSSLDDDAVRWRPPVGVVSRIDWEQLAQVAGLNRREKAVFRAHFQSGIPEYRLHVELRRIGITWSEAGALVRAINDKLSRVTQAAAESCLVVDSLTPAAYRERSDYEWSMGKMDSALIEVMRDEINFISLDSQSLRWKRQQNSRIQGREGRVLHMKTLNERLTEERSKLDRLIERRGQADLAFRDARGRLAGLERGMEAERVQAALAEREWPTPDVEKKLAPARGAMEKAAERHRDLDKACQQQSEIIREVESEIEASRQAATLLELVPRAVRINALIAELSGEINETLEVGARHRAAAHDFGLLLFPPAADLRPDDRMSQYMEIAARMAVFNSVRSLAGFLAQSGRSL